MTDTIIYTINDIAAGSGNGVADEVCIFTENDPYGALMAIIGMGIVFLILLLLFIVFNFTPRLYTPEFKEKIRNLFSRKADSIDLTPKVDAKREDLSGEVNAAIAAAIHLYRSELHDYEDTVLTINKVSRTYSPWSSKIYGLRPALRK